MRVDLVPHLPALRARLQDDRLARRRELADLLRRADRTAVAFGRRTPMVGHEATTLLIDALRRDLGDIEVALHRMHVGRYGRCLYCDQEMPLDQLMAVPQSDSCVDCRRARSA